MPLRSLIISCSLATVAFSLRLSPDFFLRSNLRSKVLAAAAPRRELTKVYSTTAPGDVLVRSHGLEMAMWKTLRSKPKAGVSRTSQAKQLFKRYGAAYLCTSITLALASYAVCYALVARGLDIPALLARVGLASSVSPGMGKGAIAYAVHKAASPIRFAPTVALTPYVSEKVFRR
mmetsp:Transcript_15045/g.44918  ORF Transcript_15045/g.44918 Transcript_15045/m.44918 type:complete len:175 (-) Transcript_15045:43-567(-)